jgi:hypothetical protein
MKRGGLAVSRQKNSEQDPLVPITGWKFKEPSGASGGGARVEWARNPEMTQQLKQRRIEAEQMQKQQKQINR